MLKTHVKQAIQALAVIGSIAFVIYGNIHLVNDWHGFNFGMKILMFFGDLAICLLTALALLSGLLAKWEKEKNMKLEKLNASLRNKLSPSKNLTFMIKELFGTAENPKDLDEDKLKKLLKLLRESSDQTRKNIDIIVEMADKYCSKIPVDEKYSNSQ